MSTVQKIAKNTSVIIAGNIITKFVGVFVTIYLARYLGTVGFGKYSFVFAYLAFFNIITDLGLQLILVREMARDWSSAPKLIGNAYIIRFALSLFAIILSIFIITLISYPADTTSYVYVAAFTLFFISFSDFYSTIFQANLAMEYSVISKIAFRFLSAGLIFYLIFTEGTLTEIILAIVFSEMVKTMLCYRFSRKFVKPDFTIDFSIWRYLFKESLPLALTSVVWIIYFRIDVVMLSMMKGDAAVGLYSAAYHLSEPLLLISSAIMISLFPIMSASFKDSKERLVKAYRLGIKYILIIMLPIAVGTTIIAYKIVFLIYGLEFDESATALQMLIWALVFISTNSVLTHLLVSMEKQKLYMISTGLCAIVNIALNFILIPVLSYNGAAIATVATNVILFIANFYFVSKYLQVLPIHKILVKLIISCLAMGAFVYYFIDINVFLLVSLAAAIYLAALLALRVFTEEDFNVAKTAMGRR